MALYDGSETDIATLVRSRELADQIVRELEATKSVRIPYVPTPVPPPPLEPEELLPPPPSLPPSNIYETSWSTTLPIAAAPVLLKKQARAKTVVSKRRSQRARSRSHLHWAVLAMSVAIAIGLWRDPIARTNAKRTFTAESHRVMKSVGEKASALKAGATSAAKRVSARVI